MGAAVVKSFQNLSFFPETTAVVVVDLQYDFTEVKKGSLAVKGTDLAYLNDVITATQALKELGCFIVATQDYHPPAHISFASTHNKHPFQKILINDIEQILWPDHCLQQSVGSDILIPEACIDYVQRKGIQRDVDCYSGFIDEAGRKTDLHLRLLNEGVNRLIVYGLALDYCVKATACDGIALGYDVYIVESLTRGIQQDETNIKGGLRGGGVGFI